MSKRPESSWKRQIREIQEQQEEENVCNVIKIKSKTIPTKKEEDIKPFIKAGDCFAKRLKEYYANKEIKVEVSSLYYDQQYLRWRLKPNHIDID